MGVRGLGVLSSFPLNLPTGYRITILLETMGNPFANATPPKRLKKPTEPGPLTKEFKAQRLNRYELKDGQIRDKITGKVFDPESALSRINELNDFILSLFMEYYTLNVELSRFKPDMREPEGALVLRAKKFYEEYDQVIS